MEHLRLVTCCCCIPIRGGVWTLAILGVLGSIWYIVQGGIFLVSGVTVNDLPWSNEDEAKAYEKILVAILKADAAFKLIFGVIHLILSILLMNGLTAYNPEKLRIWTKCNIALLALGGTALVALLIFTLVVVDLWNVGTEVVTAAGIIAFIGVALILAWEGYYIWVVHTYAKVLENQKNNNFGYPVFPSAPPKAGNA